MDIHKINEVNIEDVKSAHLRDLAIQEKYNVKYHQFWINQATNTVFCLMEGPDKESCAAVHWEANKNAACQIVEVEGGLYDLFMGKDRVIDQGLVRHINGEVDTGFRFILSLDIIANTKAPGKINFTHLKLPAIPRGKAIEIIKKLNGQMVASKCFDCLTGIFVSPQAVLDAAYNIQNLFNRKAKEGLNTWAVNYTMGISIGEPLTEKEGFFEAALQTSHRLCQIACNKEILASKYLEDFCDMNSIIENHIHLRIINGVQLDFLNSLMNITNDQLAESDFCVDKLGKEIGVSRPQLYRKIVAITGRSPVSFIRDIRLNKALNLVRENKYNVSEIALEVGYNNPSYFSRNFARKYGVKPSKIVV